MAIQVKEGRYYKDGFGKVHGPFERNTGNSEAASRFPWVADPHTFTDGGLYSYRPSEYDLVSECDKDGNPIEDTDMAEKLAMKEGSYYEDGFGKVGGPAEFLPNRLYCWRLRFDHETREYTAVGHLTNGVTDFMANIVREVPAPAPAKAEAPEAKPEPVAITQEMVDRAILDAVKAGQAGRAVEINDAWDDLLHTMGHAS